MTACPDSEAASRLDEYLLKVVHVPLKLFITAGLSAFHNFDIRRCADIVTFLSRLYFLQALFLADGSGPLNLTIGVSNLHGHGLDSGVL